MTRYDARDATARVGVGVVAVCCAKAHHIWREKNQDVGIDGEIEFVVDGRATGVLLAVQVKAGESYIDRANDLFRVKSDREHFAYWARLVIPTIGVVVDPRDHTARWTHLTALCTPERIDAGPYSVPIARSPDTAFTPETLTGVVAALARRYADVASRAFQQLRATEQVAAELRSAEASEYAARRVAWNRMCADFARSTDPDVIAYTGHRLAWHVHAVPTELASTLDDTLGALSDDDLVRIVGAIDHLIALDSNTSAELIADLLQRMPDPDARLRGLLESRRLPTEHREAAVQVLELWAGSPLPELRSKA